MSHYKRDIIILGGGPAGLAAAYYLNKAGMDFLLFEAEKNVGGNGKTFRVGDCFFDSGAHRFHDTFPEITRDMDELMKNEWKQIQSSAKLWRKGEKQYTPASFESFFSFLTFRKSSAENLEMYLRKNYGKELAEELIKYSEKKWGLPADELSANILGKNNSAKAFLQKAFFSAGKNKVKEDTFYYPDKGFGGFFDKLVQEIGVGKIKTEHVVKKIIYNDSVKQVYFSNGGIAEAPVLINTLPMPLSISLWQPALPAEILKQNEKIKLRHAVLVALVLDTNRFSENDQLYFPESDVPFTRIYEPKNRSVQMAPDNRTCIIAEIPCFEDDEYWKMHKYDLCQIVNGTLVAKGLLKPEQVIDQEVTKIRNAYPVLENHSEKLTEVVLNYWSGLKGVYPLGRNARFGQGTLQEILLQARELADLLKK